MNSVGRVKEKLSQLDKKFLRTVKKLKKSFIGSILLKLLSEIPLAILVGIAVYISTSLYTQNQTDTYQKNNLENIKIGVSYEYIESIFSIPEVDILSKEDGIRHCVHLLPNNTLFTFYDNNLLVAFFITIQSPNGSIDLAPYYQKNGLVLGKLAFSDVALPPQKISANVPGSSGPFSYTEEYYIGNPGAYNTFLYSYSDYGQDPRANAEFTSLVAGIYWGSQKELPVEEWLNQLGNSREQAQPNTFGVVSAGYSDKVSIHSLDIEGTIKMMIVQTYKK